jgi:hypothetical protein
MTANDPKGSKGSGGHKTGGRNLKLPHHEPSPGMAHDGAMIKVPPKPPTTKPSKG